MPGTCSPGPMGPGGGGQPCPGKRAVGRLNTCSPHLWDHGEENKLEPAGMAGVPSDATHCFQALCPHSQGIAMLPFIGMLDTERPLRLVHCFSCYLHKKPNQSYFLSL